MTLKDFFTLTEMKGGLTSLSRVEELVKVMQNEKNSDIVKNICDATRQWTAVATTILATDNKDCLDLFIQSNGLTFIEKWLKDALNFCTDTGDGTAEESLTSLLRAVEKLHIDNENSVSSGIWIIVKNLLDHKSSQVQDIAKSLFDSWKLSNLNDCEKADNGTNKPECDEVEFEDRNIPNSNDRSCSTESAISGALVSEGDIEIDRTKREDNSPNISPSTLDENTHVKETSSLAVTIEGIMTTDDTNQVNGDTEAEVWKSNQNSNDEKTVNPSPNRSSAIASTSSSAADKAGFSGSCIASAQDTVNEETPEKSIHGCPTKVKSGSDTQISKTDGESLSFDLTTSSDNDNMDTDVVSEEVRYGSSDEDGRICTPSPDMIGERSGMEIDYDVVDALEVARQVAQAVEREVVDYGENSSSSMEKTSGQSVKSNDDNEQLTNNIENPGNEVEKDEHDSEIFIENDETQEPEERVEKGLCVFDLNEEVDDMGDSETENLENFTCVPISVPASRPIVTVIGSSSASSMVPLQFEGNLGWKGSGPTSAFRPASPRPNSSDNNLRQNFFEIDLNVVDDSGDENLAEKISVKSEKLKLDLNLISDESEVAPISDMRIERCIFARNGQRSPSPATSSSSSIPQQGRNFDLNDRPHFFTDSFDQSPFLGKSSQMSRCKANDDVISIMGKRVEVNRNDFMTSSFPNGKSIDATIPLREKVFHGMVPAMSSYDRSSGYGYATPSSGYGYTTPPTLTFLPQAVGPASSVTPFSPSSLWMNPLNVVLPMRPNLDLNSGFATEASGNRDSGIFRQFLMPVQGRPVEDRIIMSSSQPSTSGEKRKEPDGGWEPFPFSYGNQQQPPWR